MFHQKYYYYLKPLNCMQTNEEYQIKLSLLDSNTWNHLTACEQMINIK